MAAVGARRLGSLALGEAGVTLRAFFGLPLPEAHRQALAEYLERCGAITPDFRWTPPDNLHLTIRFLGHVPESLAEGIAAGIEAARPGAFDLAIGELGHFQRGRLARVVWLGLSQGADDAGRLAALVEAESVRAGLDAEGRRYHAHLTLARARPRDGARLPELPAPPTLGAWRADELILYRSKLGRGGSVYEPLRTIKLS